MNLEKLVLASSSRRRYDLLMKLGRGFDVCNPEVKEKSFPSAYETVLFNAKLKAKKVEKKFSQKIIIAADTVVSLNDEILVKPKDYDEARVMLARLSNRWHEVLTAISLNSLSLNVRYSWVSRAKVCFYNLSPELIEQYILAVNPLDKAGAYNIDENEPKIVKEFIGDKETIMGLATKEVLQQLKSKFKF